MRLFEGTQWDVPPVCDRCGEPEAECQCPPPPHEYRAPQKQTAKLAIEKRKRGKSVVVVRGLLAKDNDLPELLTKLKTACGAGGTIKDDTLEIQGKKVELIRSTLEKIGYRVKP